MTILRLPAVCKRTGLSRSRVYKLEAEQRFPARVELGPNSVGWYDVEVQAWIESRKRRSPGRKDLTQTIGPEL